MDIKYSDTNSVMDNIHTATDSASNVVHTDTDSVTEKKHTDTDSMYQEVHTDTDSTGQEVHTDTDSVTEEKHTATDSVADDDGTTENDYSDIAFEVPDTVLQPVEEIEGDNWADEDIFEKSQDIADISYFDHTLFVGDSRTEGMVLYGGLPNLNGFCYKGLSVDKLNTDRKISVTGLKGKYTCYEAIDNTFYDNYYLMFGLNEIGWAYVDLFIEDFNELIDHILQVNPDAIIYVQSILPVTQGESHSGSIYRQDKINEYNEALREMCQDRKDVIYLDIEAAVMNDVGYLPNEATTDGIHCKADYCKRLIQYIRYNTYNKIN